MSRLVPLLSSPQGISRCSIVTNAERIYALNATGRVMRISLLGSAEYGFSLPKLPPLLRSPRKRIKWIRKQLLSDMTIAVTIEMQALSISFALIELRSSTERNIRRACPST